MTPHSLTALSLAILLGVGAVLGAEGDSEKIQGTWRVVGSEDRGRKVRAEELKDVRLVITKDRIVMKSGDKTAEELLYKLDPSRSPRWIDLTRVAQGR